MHSGLGAFKCVFMIKLIRWLLPIWIESNFHHYHRCIKRTRTGHREIDCWRNTDKLYLIPSTNTPDPRRIILPILIPILILVLRTSNSHNAASAVYACVYSYDELIKWKTKQERTTYSYTRTQLIFELKHGIQKTMCATNNALWSSNSSSSEEESYPVSTLRENTILSHHQRHARPLAHAIFIEKSKQKAKRKKKKTEKRKREKSRR